ncbi:MAG TPA: ATP-dependent sacrificial sulfur transferase LarE [Stenomitos sp.]
MTVDGLLSALEGAIARHASAIVAYSGGIDSALIAVVAHRVLGERMLAVTSTSASLAPTEREAAIAFAAEHGLPHRLIETRELDNPAYAANNADRCYHCKSTLYADLAAIARAEGYATLLNGTNADDLGDYRPGLQAASESGVASPFLEVGMTKAQVRELARHLGLAIWDKPAAACLASRLPYGTPVTLEVLDQVARAELVLAQAGFLGARVRHHGDLARIEVRPDDLEAAFAYRARLTADLKALGYCYVTLDLEGYRVGSLNASLT